MEGFATCPSCMRKAGEKESEVNEAEGILDIANIINMRDTGKSKRSAIESILRIMEREGVKF
ncbi:hypothetical protein FACS1894111_05920 [Clostridia bacterium]|nr:hypothetical protein FACS1894111_05920 [Clostridia bacterium]